ncbi:MAG: DNA-3-methyladenine glycosylase 2 family protein [FCB group bacterium]|nr:DNA-3-methyladenine glycosylase 2 family protein [FCB group bacterium]
MNEQEYRQAIKQLCAEDADLKQIIAEFGVPEMRVRKPGFSTLIYIILEQQVSLASARAVFDRLQKIWNPADAETFLKIEDQALRDTGFSRQKIQYTKIAAKAILADEIDLEKCSGMTDELVRDSLMKLKGIGRWTADIYLMMAMRRPDIWPGRDLAIIKAMQNIKGFDSIPTETEMKQISDNWRPFRSAAAMILWHYYLSKKG